MDGYLPVGDTVALGYRYPTPSSLAQLDAAIDAIPAGEVERHLRRFVLALRGLSLGQWEELHTATLDLSAPVVPYVGHVVWGENYRRGTFMAALQAAMVAAGVSLDGELPDHIAPILRYLAVTPEPLPELLDVLPGAVVEMEHTLRKAAPDNPYRHLLAATVACAANKPVRVGGRR
jgi:nitrate reductase delta subunit